MHRLIVKPHRPLYSLAVTAIGAILLSICVWLLLDNYYRQYSATAQEYQTLADTHRELKSENKMLKGRLTILDRDIQVKRTANGALDTEIINLRDEVRNLKSELHFYQDIISAAQGSGSLNIQGLLLEPAEAQYYRFKLVVTQAVKNANIVSEGVMDLSVEGTENGDVRTLNLSDITADGELEPNFEFDNFKRIDGNLVLPDGFEPIRIIVRLYLKGQENAATERIFDWSDLI